MRYIVAGPIATIQSVTSGKGYADKGEKVNLTLTLTGTPRNIQTNASSTLNGANVSIILTNDKGKVVGTATGTADLNLAISKIDVPVSISERSSTLTAQVTVSYEGKELANYSTPLTQTAHDFSKDDLMKILTWVVSILLAIILIVLVVFVFKRNKKAGIISIIILILLAGFLFFKFAKAQTTGTCAGTMSGSFCVTEIVGGSNDTNIGVPFTNPITIATNGTYYITGSIIESACENSDPLGLNYILNYPYPTDGSQVTVTHRGADFIGSGAHHQYHSMTDQFSLGPFPVAKNKGTHKVSLEVDQSSIISMQKGTGASTGIVAPAGAAFNNAVSTYVKTTWPQMSGILWGDGTATTWWNGMINTIISTSVSYTDLAPRGNYRKGYMNYTTTCSIDDTKICNANNNAVVNNCGYVLDQCSSYSAPNYSCSAGACGCYLTGPKTCDNASWGTWKGVAQFNGYVLDSCGAKIQHCGSGTACIPGTNGGDASCPACTGGVWRAGVCVVVPACPAGIYRNDVGNCDPNICSDGTWKVGGKCSVAACNPSPYKCSADHTQSIDNCNATTTCSSGMACVDATGSCTPITSSSSSDTSSVGSTTITSLKIVPNTINPFDGTATNPGKCNLVWTVNQYDASSTCTVYGGKINGNNVDLTKGIKTITGSTTGTIIDVGISNETTYHITCGESTPNGITATSTRYATCYMNAEFKETN